MQGLHSALLPVLPVCNNPEAPCCWCRFSGHVAAVRLALDGHKMRAAKQEVAAYQTMKHLQGVCVPRLLAHGYTLGGSAYSVATEFIEVQCYGLPQSQHLLC